MRVVIAGGHGKVALLLSRRLEDSGEEVVSLIRNPAHAADVEAAGGDPLVLDLEQAEADEIVAAIGAADAIVFAAGAGPGSGNERKESVDYGAAAKLIDAGGGSTSSASSWSARSAPTPATRARRLRRLPARQGPRRSGR